MRRARCSNVSHIVTIMLADFIKLLCLGGMVVVMLFTVTWLLSLKLNNFSFVDITWSYSLASLVPIYVLLGRGQGIRKIVFGLLALAWSLRLGTYLLRRIRRHHPSEDARYQVLRAKWKSHLQRNFFWFFQAQAALILLLSVPLLLACLNPQPALGLIEWIGMGVTVISLMGEAVADAQMGWFKRRGTSSQEVCRVGLWRYSRHPNYFFESLVWWGFWLMACGSPWGWVTVYAPLLMLYFLLRVTGIPLTEACAVASKGEAYRAYQRSTSAFIPWFPKSSS